MHACIRYHFVDKNPWVNNGNIVVDSAENLNSPCTAMDAISDLNNLSSLEAEEVLSFF